MRYKIIVNPVAGKGGAGRMVPSVEHILSGYSLNYDIVRTKRPWHAAELAEEAVSEGYDTVVAMGGDGTVNEVINGLMQAKQAGNNLCSMGVLCVGNGNDFAYGVEIPHDLETGCRVLAQGNKRSIDIGCVIVDNDKKDRYFGNGVGIGFDAVVSFEVLKMKRITGLLSYVIAALKTLFLYFNAPVVRIEYQGQSIVKPSLMISIMNGQRMGGGFKMAPEAKTDDGLFDLCIAGEAGRLRILYLMYHFLRGTQDGKKHIETGRTKQIIISVVEGTLPAHADGETLCRHGKRLEVELMSKQLDIICPVEEV